MPPDKLEVLIKELQPSWNMRTKNVLSQRSKRMTDAQAKAQKKVTDKAAKVRALRRSGSV